MQTMSASLYQSFGECQAESTSTASDNEDPIVKLYCVSAVPMSRNVEREGVPRILESDAVFLSRFWTAAFAQSQICL